MSCLTRTDIPCFTDSNGCVVCPEIPGSPSVPPVYTNTPVLGWNAGANSIALLDGDLFTTFALPVACDAIVVGFKSTRTFVTEPTLIPFGLYFTSAGGNQYVNVIENGVSLTAPVLCAPSDTFSIGRYGGIVGYKQNSTLLYRSLVGSVGPLLVNSCLYASGDTIA